MNTVEQLKRDEGFRASVYIDTVGKHTIGYGHNLDAKPISWIGGSTVLTFAQAEQILENDITDARLALTGHLPWAVGLDEARLGVLVNMAFNMGVPGLMAFKNTLAAFHARDWEKAAQGMESSKWYAQVGIRARRLVQQVRTGAWQ